MSANRRQFLKTSGSAVAVSSLLAGCLGRDDGEFPDPDRTMRFIVPYSTGGGFDSYTRAIAEFFPNYLPNEIDTVVENRPGAGGVTGATEIYQADPDGYTLGIFNNPGMLVAQLVQDVQYEMDEVSWIAQIASQSYGLAVNPDTGYETVSDLQETDQISMAHTGPGSVDLVNQVIAFSEMDIEAENVTGYDGSQERTLATIRGDTEGTMTSATTPSLVEPIEQGDLNPVVYFDTELPNYVSEGEAQTIVEAGYPDLVDVIGFQRLFGGPPGIDEERLELLRDAFIDMLEGDEMQEWSESNDRPIIPMHGSEVSEMLEATVDTYTEFLDILEDAIEE